MTTSSRSLMPPWLRLLLLGIVALVVIVAGWRLVSIVSAPAEPAPAASLAATATLPPSPAASTPVTASTPLAIVNAPANVAPTPGPAAPPALGPGETLLELTPAPDAVGWVSSNDALGNHLGDSFLHAGVFRGQVFHGVVQFDLSSLPPGAPLRYAALTLTGLEDGRLNRAGNGVWEVRWLAPQILQTCDRCTFQDIHNAAVLQSILPPLGQASLAPLAVNTFPLSADQLALLEQAVLNRDTLLFLRLDGPLSGEDDLFTWDAGYGPATRGNQPILLVAAGAPPATPPAIPTEDYIVVTSTPTPENVLTAAAIVQTATALATQVGAPTPTPFAMVTATSTPLNEATAQAERLRLGLPPVVTATPTPANDATATSVALFATAVAQTTGTWTPSPPNLVTATATPTFAVITNTPTPANVATRLAQALAEATRTVTAGPPTAIPAGVVTATPRWIAATNTPTPENLATVQARGPWATVVALTTGTYTPTPANLATATWTPAPTPLPLLMPLSLLTPTPTPQVTGPTPNAVPDFLRGRIIFMSDRFGEPRLFVMDGECVNRPGGCGAAAISWLTQSYPYLLARQRDALAPDGRARLLVRPDNQLTPQVYREDLAYGTVQSLTSLAGATYDPVWSPNGNYIALVSTEAGNDEIYRINADGSNLRRLTTNAWEWDKHPTWSPDGSQILFYSNRETGRRQLWVMDAEGGGQRSVSNNEFNDWDPVWVK